MSISNVGGDCILKWIRSVREGRKDLAKIKG